MAFNKWKMVPVGLGVIVFAASAGTISGSLAWWAYSTRVSVSYHGTSVSTSEQLQIGLKLYNFTDSQVDALTDLGLEEDDELADGTYRYVFAKAGGGLPAATINTYLTEVNDYAVDQLTPLTSRTFTTGPLEGAKYYVASTGKVQQLDNATWQDMTFTGTVLSSGLLPAEPNKGDTYFVSGESVIKIWSGNAWESEPLTGTVASPEGLPTGSNVTLYETLIFGNQNNTDLAEHRKYVYIPFVFRILKLNAVSASDKYADGRKIYLSKVVADVSSENPGSKVTQGLRLAFDNGTFSNKFILNPTYVRGPSETGTLATDVCGILDLNDDGYYDDTDGKEIIYGDRTINSDVTFHQDTYPTELDDINETGESTNSTFLAYHMQGNDCYADYSGITKGQAQFLTLGDIKPDDSKPVLSGGVALCQTSDAGGNFLAELETIIWLEGWDHAVIDNVVSHQFDLGLQFQIDLVN